MSFLKNFLLNEDGQDLVEYGLVIALLVAAAAALLGSYFTNVEGGFTKLGTAVAAAL